jgi:hypothetical protein
VKIAFSFYAFGCLEVDDKLTAPGYLGSSRVSPLLGSNKAVYNNYTTSHGHKQVGAIYCYISRTRVATVPECTAHSPMNVMDSCEEL